MAQSCSIPVIRSSGLRPVAPSPTSWFARWFGLDLRALALARVGLVGVAVLVLIAVATRGPAGPGAALSIGGTAGSWVAVAWWVVWVLTWPVVLAVGTGLGRTAAVVLALLLVALAAGLPVASPFETQAHAAGAIALALACVGLVGVPANRRWAWDAALDVAPLAMPNHAATVGVAWWRLGLLLAAGLVLAHLFAGWPYRGMMAVLDVPAAMAVGVALAAAALTLLGALPWPGWRELAAIGVVAAWGSLGIALAVLADPFVALVPLTLAAASLALMPGRLFDAWMVGWSRTRPTWRTLRVYYDGDCGFCQLMARAIRVFMVLPDGSVHTGQSDPAIHEVMERENSWVLKPSEGSLLTHFDGLIELARLSPVMWPFAWLLRLVRGPGNRLYRWVAAHRHSLGWWVGWLHYRELPPLRPTAGHIPSRRLPRLSVALGALIFCALAALLIRSAVLAHSGRSTEGSLIGEDVRSDEPWQRLDPLRSFAGHWR